MKCQIMLFSSTCLLAFNHTQDTSDTCFLPSRAKHVGKICREDSSVMVQDEILSLSSATGATGVTGATAKPREEESNWPWPGYDQQSPSKDFGCVPRSCQGERTVICSSNLKKIRTMELHAARIWMTGFGVTPRESSTTQEGQGHTVGQ